MSSTRDTSHPDSSPCVASAVATSSTATFSAALSAKTPLASAAERSCAAPASIVAEEEFWLKFR